MRRPSPSPISSATSSTRTCGPAGSRRSTPASRPSPTATSTSATPSRSASTSAWPRDYGGLCNLRFDDTNPETEEIEYVDSIKEDVRWLGFDWEDREYYASDYFEQLYEWAVVLIKKGKAYVCDLSADQVREYRGTVTRAGQGQPLPRTAPSRRTSTSSRGCGRASSPTARGRCGPRSTWPTRTCTCATRSCTGSGGEHHTGRATPGASTRPTTGPTASATRSRASPTPSAPWSSRSTGRSTTGSSTSSASTTPSRSSSPGSTSATPSSASGKLLELVEGRARQRLGRPAHADHLGPPPARLHAGGHPRTSADSIGVAKDNSIVDMAAARELRPRGPEQAAPRAMAVLRPLKVVITNYPEGQVEELDAVNNPEDPAAGTRKVPFSRELYIERDDFMEDPPPKFFRLSPGPRGPPALRLFHQVRRGRQGPGTGRSSSCAAPTTRRRGAGTPPDGRKVKATLHWVSAAHAIDAEVRLYDTLFTKRDPGERRRGRRTGWPTSTQIPRGHRRRQARARPGERRAGEPLPVRAPGLLLRRPARFQARRPRFQPDRDPARRLGQDRQGRKGRRLNSPSAPGRART